MNKGIKNSLKTQADHSLFPLFHNGIIILCDSYIVDDDNECVEIKNYAVVNGAQSIKQLHNMSASISDELVVLTRIIDAKKNDALANKITERTNTQNGVKPRDMRSNDSIQSRLASAFEENGLGYHFEIKRGDAKKPLTITNEHAAKLLLAFDLEESFATHQVSSLFETRYTDIFARPIVNAERIIALHVLYDTIDKSCTNGLTNKSFASYGLTKYLVLQALGRVFRDNGSKNSVFLNLSKIIESNQSTQLIELANEILKDIIVDLDYEEKSNDKGDGNYKSDLKNKKYCENLISDLLKSREKEIAKGRTKDLSSQIEMVKLQIGI